MRDELLDPEKVGAFAASFPDVGMARMVYSCTHTTFAPTVVHGGIKTNVIPDAVDLEVDIRTLPGHGADEVQAMLREALGDLSDAVEIQAQSDDRATASPVDTPLYRAVAATTERLIPGARMVPFLVVGATDARFFRRAGAVAYGTGLFSDRIAFADFASMFHGDDERIDQESLRLGTDYFEALSRELAG
jgi:acetylornithine deacetylase/succinyl-diaminopimelate desuccinylase-like protein